MSKLLKRLKMKTSVREQIEREERPAKRPTDLRVLNYHDMKDGERMELLFLPWEDGTFWKEYKVHGPNISDSKGRYISGVKNVGCTHEIGQKCPGCQMGYDFLDLRKSTGDEQYLVEAKKWFGKDYRLMQCIVLNSPVEVNQDPDGNRVKLVSMPYGAFKTVRSGIVDGVIDEEEISTTPFILKKEHPEGKKFASYDGSYWARKPIDPSELADIPDEEIRFFEYEELRGNYLPELPTIEAVQKWVDETEVLVMKANNMEGSEQDDEEEERPRREARPVRQEAPARKEAPEPEQPDYDEDIPEEWERKEPAKQEEAEEPVSKPSSGGESVRDRLARLRR